MQPGQRCKVQQPQRPDVGGRHGGQVGGHSLFDLHGGGCKGYGEVKNFDEVRAGSRQPPRSLVRSKAAAMITFDSSLDSFEILRLPVNIWPRQPPSSNFPPSHLTENWLF